MNKKNVKIFTFISLIFITLLIIGGVSAVADENQATRNDDTIQSDVITTSNDVQDTNEIIKTDKNVKKDSLPADNYEELKNNIDMLSVVWDEESEDPSISLAEGETFTIDEPIVWGSDSTFTTLTINGNGATIDGSNTYQFITVNEGYTLNLNNIIIQNTYSNTNGGAIKNYGTLNLNNVTFDSNTVNKGDGSAIFSDGTATIYNSKFTNNHITGGVNGDEGAAIHATGALYVYNSDFDANIAEYTDTSSSSNGANGGAIAVVNSISDFIVDNSTFTNNKGRHGGAILVYDSQGRNQGTKKITGSTFTGNQAIYGGAIETYNDLIIEDSTFEENSVKGIGSGNRNPLGGAICVNNMVISGTAGSLSAKNVTFTKNTAPEASTAESLQGYGGAIYNSGPDSTIDNCTFTQNSAYYGGAYYANTNRTECMDVTITNSNFVENTAHDGAAIWDKHYQSSTTPSSMTIEDCQFKDNNATYSYGSTIKGDYSNLVVRDTNISDSNRYAIYLHMSEKAKSMNNVTINGLTNINSLQTMNPSVSVTDYAQLVAVSKQINNDYTGTASVTISLEGTDYTETEPIVFENNTCTVTINGNGKTIDADGMQFLTVAQGKTVQLNNLTIANARAANGSAIMNLGTLTVNNAIFENNVATENGGAIYVKAGTNAKLTVGKTSFVDNNAINGGALFTSIGSTISLTDTNFTSNNATYGGAIHTYNTTLTLTKVNFNQNNATYGGAICAYNTTKTTAKNTNFTANTADSQGGAVWNDHGSVLTTNNTNFTNNKAGVSGGAVWNRYSNITANNTQFVNNEAGSGGAIYNSVGTVVANQSTFNTNKATSDIGKGGAIWTDDEISIIKSEFTENTAVVDGGAIYTGFSSRSFDPTFTGYNINITESTFNSNTAGSQGGAVYTTYITNITDSNFTANKAANGGAIFITPDEFADFAGVEYSDVTINNVTFDANEALYNGGAIYSNGTLNVNDSTFTNNKMTTHQAAGRNDYGGGAICAFKELNVNNSVFIENLAAHNDVEPRGDGGVAGAILVLNNSQAVSITSSNFTANSGRHGGAITINNNDVENTNKVTIDNNNFVENTALYGGAIDTYQQVNITNNNFTKNIITGQGSGERVPMGAAICINQGNDEYTVIVQNNNFIENEAKDNGVSGVIHTQDGTTLTSSNNLYENNKATDTGVVTVFDKATFTNDTFIGNTADYTGVFTNYNELTIDNCTFENNEGNGYGDLAYAFNDMTITNSIIQTDADTELVSMNPDVMLTATDNTINNVVITQGLVPTIIDDLEDTELVSGETITIVVRAISDNSIVQKGRIEIKVAGEDTFLTSEYTITEEGFAVIIDTDLIGDKEVNVMYFDDSEEYTYCQKAITLSFKKNPTIEANDITVARKSQELTNVIVKDGETVIQTGTISFEYDNGTAIPTTVTDVSDEGFIVSVPGEIVGTHTVYVIYTADDESIYSDYITSINLIVTPTVLELGVYEEVNAYVDTDFDLTIDVLGQDEAIEGAALQIFVGGEEIDSSRFVYGDAGYLVTLNTDKLGTNTMTIKFTSNNENYTDAEATVTLTLNKVEATISTPERELTATIDEDLSIPVQILTGDDTVTQGTISVASQSGLIMQTIPVTEETTTITLPTDVAGTKTYHINYQDDKYTAESIDLTVTTNKISVTINADEEEYYVEYGEDADIIVTIDNDGTPLVQGMLNVYEDGALVKSVDVTEEFTTISMKYDDVDVHALTIEYVDDKYTAEDVDVTVIMTAKEAEIIADDYDGFVGDNVVITASVECDGTSVNVGTVTFTNAAGEELGSFNLADGTATLDLGVINEEYSDEIYISYYSNYYQAEDTMVYVELLKKFADITLTTGEVSIASPVTITANVEFEDDVINQGQIVFTDDEGNILDTVDIENNIATTTVTFNDAGIYTVYAEIVDDVYVGDNSIDITVEKIPVTISISDNQNVAVGSSATITATINSDNGVVNSGKVIFTKGTTTLGEIEVVENTASIDYTPTSAGESTITAKYIPGDNYSIEEDTATCTITANKIATTTTIDSVTLTSGKTVTLTAHITADDDSIVNGGKVAFKVNGKTLKDTNGKVIYATVVDGVATVEYEVPSTLNGKDVSIQAVYSGSTKYVNSKDTLDETTTVLSGTANIEITSQSTFTKGQTATLSAKVTDNNVNINAGKIVFKINGKTVKNAEGKVIYATVAEGVASLEYTIPDTMKSKEYTLTAVFISSDYDRCEATQSITIQ